MPDKETIIHGVDVSKCEFYDKDKGYCLTLKMNPKGFKNPSCFSGDFQKCTQENKICPNTFCHNNSNCYYKQLSRKIEEYELLARTNKIHTDILGQLSEKYIDLEQECENYKQALEEIEEYIYTDCEYNDGCDRHICIRCKYSNTHDKRILDIINKVEDGNDEENNKR